jgi:hypothetical protein
MPTIAPRYGLWETVGMANRKKHIPKLDDRVAVLGHTGAFVISSVDGDLRTVELKPIGRHFALSAIPWRALRYLDEEDKVS